MKSVNENEQRYLERKYGTVVGIPIEMIDCDNTEFTDFIAENRNSLVNYARTLNIDVNKADDLINDAWYSYKINEENGKGYDMSAGHGDIITVEEAIKARLKLMAKNSIYHRATDGGQEVLAHFTEDTEDDSIQNSYTNMASVDDINAAIIEENFDLAENMQYFISCTRNCRVSGLTVLEKIDAIVEGIESDVFNANFISDLWVCSEGMKDCFSVIFSAWSRNKKTYASTLATVKEEFMKCRKWA